MTLATRGILRMPAILCLLAVSWAGLRAQPASAPSTTAGSRTVEYRLKAGDQISLNFEQVSQYLNKTRTIDSNGNFPLNWIGDIALAGLTVREAQEKIQRAYLENDMLRAPKVTIVVETYTRSTVSIPNNVRTPGLVNLDPTKTNTLVDVILRADGFSELAKGNEVYIVRVQADGRPVKLGPFKVDDMMKGREPIDKAPVMQPDDIVEIPIRFF